MRTLHARPSRAGFSLIELLAVMIILSILVVFLAFRLGGMGEAAKRGLTETYLTEVSTVAAEFEHETGDYPPSSWNADWGAQPDKTNLGIEALCIALWSEDYGGTGLNDDKLGNSDEDRSKKSLTTHAVQDLFELNDAFGNPIAYFHRRDYGRADLYVTVDQATGEWVESTAKALTNPKTGNYYNPRSFQLISAGEDGLFGTDDDITNFSREE